MQKTKKNKHDGYTVCSLHVKNVLLNNIMHFISLLKAINDGKSYRQIYVSHYISKLYALCWTWLKT